MSNDLNARARESATQYRLWLMFRATKRCSAAIPDNENIRLWDTSSCAHDQRQHAVWCMCSIATYPLQIWDL